LHTYIPYSLLISASYPATGNPVPATPAGYPPAGYPMVSPAGCYPITGTLFVPSASYHPFTFYPYMALAGRRGTMVISRRRGRCRSYFHDDLRKTSGRNCHKEGNHDNGLI